VRPHKHYCSVVSICIESYECVSIFFALFIQKSQRMRHIIMPFVACLTVSHFPKISHKPHDFRWRNEHKFCIFISSTNWSEAFLIIRRNQPDILVSV